MTLVSVVMPTWQRHALLADRAIPSVLAQTMPDLELIVVSDGPDAVAERIAASFGDPRVRFMAIERPDYPAEPVDRWRVVGAAAINAGIDAAVGDWLLVMGDDDELVSDCLHDLLLIADASDIVYGRSHVKMADGSWTVADAGPPDFVCFPFGSALIRRSSLADARLDPRAWLTAEPADTSFWRRLHRAGLSFARTPEIVYRYFPSYAV